MNKQQIFTMSREEIAQASVAYRKQHGDDAWLEMSMQLWRTVLDATRQDGAVRTQAATWDYYGSSVK